MLRWTKAQLSSWLGQSGAVGDFIILLKDGTQFKTCKLGCTRRPAFREEADEGMETGFHCSSAVVGQALPACPYLQQEDHPVFLPTRATIAQGLGELRRPGWLIHHIQWPPQGGMLGPTVHKHPTDRLLCLCGSPSSIFY